MYIVPLTSMPLVAPTGENQQMMQPQAAIPEGLPFADILADAVRTVEQTREVSSQNNYDVALGMSDDMHNAQIDSLKAATALDFTSGLVTKAISAYNEIIRISI